MRRPVRWRRAKFHGGPNGTRGHRWPLGWKLSLAGGIWAEVHLNGDRHQVRYSWEARPGLKQGDLSMGLWVDWPRRHAPPGSIWRCTRPLPVVEAEARRICERGLAAAILGQQTAFARLEIPRRGNARDTRRLRRAALRWAREHA